MSFKQGKSYHLANFAKEFMHAYEHNLHFVPWKTGICHLNGAFRNFSEMKKKQQEFNISKDKKRKREKNNSLKIEKFKKRHVSQFDICPLQKNEHVKLVFSKNSQQCWKQMMLKELFNFLKKFNSPWDCKKTTKVPTKNCHKFPCDEKMRTENTVSNIITSGHSWMPGITSFWKLEERLRNKVLP